MINKLILTQFGKFSDKEIDLNGGVNLFVANNGVGKSTIGAFVKAMLYGFDNNNSDKDRAKFRPWGMDSRFKYGGSMIVTYKETQFKVTRRFGSTKASDELIVEQVSTGRASEIFVNGVGETLLNIDKASYERCVYIPQYDVEITNNDNFTAKLNNMIDDTDNVSGDRAIEKLTKLQGRVSGRGINYFIDETSRKLRDKERQIEATQLIYREIDYNLERIEENTAYHSSLAKDIKNIEKQLASLDKVRENQEVWQRLELLTQQRSKQLIELNTAKDCLGNIDVERLDVEKLSHQMEQLGATERACQEKEAQLATLDTTQTESKQTNKFVLPLFIVSLILLTCGIACGVLLDAYLFIVAGVGAIVLISSGVIYAKGYIDNATTGNSNTAQTQLLVSQFVEQYENSKDKRQQLLEFLTPQLSIDGCQDVGVVFSTYYKVIELIGNYKFHLGKYEEINEQVNQLASLAKRDGIAKFDSEKYNELKLKQQKWNTSLHEREMLISNAKTENKLKLAKLVEISVLESEREQLQAKLNIYKQQETALALGIECLRKAKEKLANSYIPLMVEQLNESIGFITEGEWSSVNVDAQFKVRLSEKGLSYELDNFSKGIKEICLFSLRLALSKLLYDGQVPLLILDDPFVNFDEDKFDKAIRIIKELGTNTQVLLFSCHDRSRRINEN